MGNKSRFTAFEPFVKREVMASDGGMVAIQVKRPTRKQIDRITLSKKAGDEASLSVVDELILHCIFDEDKVTPLLSAEELQELPMDVYNGLALAVQDAAGISKSPEEAGKN